MTVSTQNGFDVQNGTDVQLLESLSPGLSVVSATLSQGTYDVSTGLSTIGNLTFPATREPIQ